ncbi:MAG: Ig-like domain-containing protein [Paucibacter sp.]|nr:Ig-like domain-containing protein [Roseateles sp.]
MNKLLTTLALLTAQAGCAASAVQPQIAAPDVAQQSAPADGFAAQTGGTQGGASATPEHIYTVENRAQLLAALANGGNAAKIIKVVGRIDMSEGQPFASHADQVLRAAVSLPSNTTLFGAGPGAGFINAQLLITGVSQVIVRNLKIVAPCDVAPVWDPTDGATGNWNAAFDAISVAGADHIWIDRNTLTDAPLTDDQLPIENGKTKQCHDGLLDITQGADYVTVSYNVFEQHNKTILVGGSDSASGDAGRLRVSFSNNVFNAVTQRAPRVRYGQVHLFNNYYAGSKSDPVYPHSYSVGVGKAAQILSHSNLFSIAGAAHCDALVVAAGNDLSGAFKDSGSTVNGAPLGACSVASTVAWTPPYAYKLRPIALVKANALAQAGAGKLKSSISGSGNVGGSAGSLVPAKGETGVHSDTRLSLSFDAAPTLGTSGKIYVRRVSDDALVDSIDISNAPSSTDTQTVLPRGNLEIDALGLGALPESALRARFVWYRPVSIQGNTATIKLHNNKLAFNTAYYITVDAGVFGASINGSTFAGISAADGWTFTTKAAPTSYTQLNVAASGTAADFRSLQGALNWVMTHCSTGSPAGFGCNTVATPKLIQVADGNYAELNLLRNVANLTIQGESREGVGIGEVNFESLNSGSGASATAAGTALSSSGKTVGHRVLGGGRAALLVENADLLQLHSFSLHNPHVRSSAYDNQAETLYFNTSQTPAAARLVAKQMNFLSQQDTLQLKGYVWIYQSLVAGNVDYIWGGVMAALFEDCEIRSVFDAASNSPGYILQARAVAGDKGFVFLNSRLTAGPGVTQAYLARSGGTASSSYIDNIAFINNQMDAHILPIGWCVGTGTSKTGVGTGACGTNPPSYAGTANGGTTDAAGWRESGSTDMSGVALNVAARLSSQSVKVGGVPTPVVLAKQMDSLTGYGNRAEIFYNSTIATGAPGGWAPQTGSGSRADRLN